MIAKVRRLCAGFIRIAFRFHIFSSYIRLTASNPFHKVEDFAGLVLGTLPSCVPCQQKSQPRSTGDAWYFTRDRPRRGRRLSKKREQRWRPLLRVPRASRPRGNLARSDRDGHGKVTLSAPCCQGGSLNMDSVIAWLRGGAGPTQGPRSICCSKSRPREIEKAVYTMSGFRKKA